MKEITTENALPRAAAPDHPGGRRAFLILGAPVYHLLRLGLAGIFAYAGVVKLLHPSAFAHSLAQYQLIPDSLLLVVAVGLPVVELLAGLGLVIGRRGSLTTISVMLLAFTLILGYAILFDLDIDCGCFSLEEIGERNSVKTAFYRDLILLAVIFLLFWWRRYAGRLTGNPIE